MKKFVFRRALAVTRKEVFHILRDPFTLRAAIGIPIFMVVIFGMAIEFNVKNISMAVYDNDKTQYSRQLIESFDSSEYFTVKYVNSPQEAIDQLTTNSAKSALIIPPNFQANLSADRNGEVQILLDGSDNSTVVPILGYISSIEAMASFKILDYKSNKPYEVRTRFMFNPELNSKWFIVPGLSVVVMGILSVLLTSLTVAGEYERGSMELLLSTPLRPIEIIIGKLTPYAVLGIISVVIIYIIARVFFGVPFVGSYFVYGLGVVLFLVAYLAQGLLISVSTRNQFLAMQVALLTALLPTQLLSGFIFPISDMPAFFQWLTTILPARWFMQISRDVYLQGTGLIQLGIPFLSLLAFCLVIVFMSIKSFRRDVEP